MSVDYSSVLIYGVQIPLTNDNCAAMWRATGGKEFWEYAEIVDEQFPEMRFITDNGYSDPELGYFGVVIDDEIELDPTDVKSWIRNQRDAIHYAFIQFFGDEFFEQLGCPMLKLYHFVRPW